MCDTASTKAKKNEIKQQQQAQQTAKESSSMKQCSGLKDHAFHSSNSNVSVSSQYRYGGSSENESLKTHGSMSPKSPSLSRVAMPRPSSTRKKDQHQQQPQQRGDKMRASVRITKNDYSSNENSLTTSSSGSLPVSRAHSTSASTCTLASAGAADNRTKKHKSVFDRLSLVSKKFNQPLKAPK